AVRHHPRDARHADAGAGRTLDHLHADLNGEHGGCGRRLPLAEGVTMRHETIDRWLDRAAFIGVGIVICMLALVAFPVVVAGDVRLDVASPPAASTVKVLAGQGHGSGVSIGGGYI